MCPQYFYRLRIMCFYRGDRDIHLIGDFLIRKIPFQLIQTDLAFLLRQVIDRLVKMRHHILFLYLYKQFILIFRLIVRSHNFSLRRYYYSGSHLIRDSLALYRDSSLNSRSPSVGNVPPTISEKLAVRHLPKNMYFSNIYRPTHTIIYDTAHK